MGQGLGLVEGLVAKEPILSWGLSRAFSCSVFKQL